MKVLLSIKPEFADRIFDGTKKYEYRRMIFKNSDVKKVIVYASSPVRRVIGEFEVEGVLRASPEEIWRATKEHAGISKDSFFAYFALKEEGFAIKIRHARRYRRARCLQSSYNVVPPQSFCYLW